MMTHTGRHPLARQRGIASVLIVVVLFLAMAAALATRLDMTAGVVDDAATVGMRLQALYLAESGLERAARRYTAGGVACGSLAENDIAYAGVGSFSISAGSALAFDGVSSGSGSCRVQVTGKAATGGVVRVVEAILTPFVITTASRGSKDFVCTVPAGENLLAVISVSWSNPVASTLSVASVTLGGVTATAVANPVRNNDATLRVSAQNFYVKNPPTGASVAGTVTMSANPAGMIVGCLTLAGVNQTSPVDAFNSSFGQGGNPSVTVSTASANTFVIDNLVRDNGGNLSMVNVANPTRTEMWNFTPTGDAGAGSYRGPVAASGPVVMNWTWNQNRIWAIAAVSIAGDPAGGAGSRVRLPGGGVAGWREVVVAPLP